MSKCSRSSRLTDANGARPTQLRPRFNSAVSRARRCALIGRFLRNSGDQLGAAPLTKSKIRDRYTEGNRRPHRVAVFDFRFRA